MSVYSVPVTIGIDEEKIAQRIEADIENKVLDRITAEIEGVIYEKHGYNYYGRRKEEPLRDLVRGEIRAILDKETDAIIDAAAVVLAEKLARTKAVKEKAASVANDIFN